MFDINNHIPDYDYEEELIREAEMLRETEKVLASFGLNDDIEDEEEDMDFQDF